MARGGYHIIDFKNITIRNKTYISKGFYNDLVYSLQKKPILCTNLIIDNNKYQDFFIGAPFTSDITLASTSSYDFAQILLHIIRYEDGKPRIKTIYIDDDDTATLL